ncbi:MAG: trypsin-like peptidase domain-containing protein [Actinocatenispora sp.]
MKDEDRENLHPERQPDPADPDQVRHAGPDADTSGAVPPQGTTAGATPEQPAADAVSSTPEGPQPTGTPGVDAAPVPGQADQADQPGQPVLSGDTPPAGAEPAQPMSGQHVTGQHAEGQHSPDQQPWAQEPPAAQPQAMQPSTQPGDQAAWASHQTQQIPGPGYGPGAGYGSGGGTPPPYQTTPMPGGWQQQPGPYGPNPPAQRSRGRRLLAAGAAAVVLVLGGGVVGGVTVHALDNGNLVSSPVASDAVSAKGGSLANVVDQVQPSVVSLKVQPEGNQSGDEGSGVIIRSDGMILTNNHVVSSVAEGGGSITVAFSDGTQTPAKVVGTDPSGDLAVVQAQGQSGLKPATLGNSAKLRVGDGVVAIGSPLGLEGSVTQGIVSALNRSYSVAAEQEQPQQQNPFPFGQGQKQDEQQSTGQSITIPNAIQTDAAINPGNSGGPLLNMAGQVIGINSAIRSSGDSSGQAGNIGIGFAIPINTANTTADQLIHHKKVKHALLGVKVGDAVSDSAGSSGSPQGALVGDVTSGGPAAKAGLKKGDVITKVDNARVTDSEALVSAVSEHKPGDKVTVAYTRDGAQKSAEVTLGTAPN